MHGQNVLSFCGMAEEGFRSLVLPSRSLSSSPDIDDVDGVCL